MTLFFRILDVPVADKARALLGAIRETAIHDATSDEAFEIDAELLKRVPGSPFAYWLPEKIRQAFATLPPFENEERVAKHGGVTLDDPRFLRLWSETAESSLGVVFVPFAKGGPARKFYADLPVCIRWSSDGAEVKAHASAVRERNGWGDQWTAVLNGYIYYLRPGLTWPLRGAKFSPQVLPAGCIFSARGYCIFAPEDSLMATLGLCASTVFDYLFKIRLGRFGHPEFVVGVIEGLPVPTPNAEVAFALADSAKAGWKIRYQIESGDETSRNFILPEALSKGDASAAERELARVQDAIDEIAFRLYGFGETEVAHVQSFQKRSQNEQPDDGEEENECEDEARVGAAADGVSSWLVGVSFGRFDPRLATGERPIPTEPEPFAELPSRSPGMWPQHEGPAQRADILVDDEGHADDLVARARGAAERARLDIPEDFRSWLRHFFPLHIKMYSKSRRKAPIYWQLATTSASYSVWLYIHAFTKDTLFRVQNDYVAPKLAHEERRLEETAREAHEKGTAAQRKELSSQENFVGELRAFLDEVKRVTPLWNPNLDDGVIINFAPLWRLVPQHKAWQKELKSTWDALCDGKYDWAHLAMHLWPERVVLKCATDRSLAIAHGLEDVFWVEGNDGKWTARENPTQSVEDLVRERTSPAVKAALKSLLDAPQPAGSGRKSKKG